MPAFVLPQVLLCGLLVPRDQMASALQVISRALPLTYAFDALDRLANRGALGATGTLDVTVVLALIALALALGTATLRRRSA